MKELTYATVCSGIECMSAAVADLPMKPVFFSEIEPFPSAVLKSHFPDVPNLGDMSKITVTNEGKEITNGSVRIVLERNLDIFAGGTPCQDVSVAGKRSGMQEGSGTRSSLAFEFVRLVRELKPRYVLWENVAGVLSDKSFPEFLTALANCGYGVAYRTLDAQWVRCADCYHEDGGVVRMERAIPQRRRRVWVVGCIGGDVAKAAQILFEQKGVAGDNAPRRRTGQEIAAALRGRNRVHGGMVGGAVSCTTRQISLATAEQCAGPIISTDYKEPQCIALDGDKLKPRTDQRKGGNGFGINEDGAGYTLTGVDRYGVAYKTSARGEDVSSTLMADDCGQSGQDYERNSIVECYENHAQDSRVKPIAVAPTFGSPNANSMGISGNNPIVCFSKVSHPHGKDGEGARWDNGEVASTRNVFDISETRSQECVVHQPTKLCLDMMGGKIGAHHTDDDTAPTLTHGRGSANDVHAVVSTNSNGGDVMPTLDGKGQSASGPGAQEDKRGGYIIHKKCFGINPVASGVMLDAQPQREVSMTLRMSPGGENVVIQMSQMRYIVRRLTPTECERLTGLPDGWTIPKNLEVTDALVEESREKHDTFKRIMAEYDGSPTPKPTSAAQVRKWLEKITNPDTCPDAPRYKACGNGWATNQPRWILTRLLTAEGVEW